MSETAKLRSATEGFACPPGTRVGTSLGIACPGCGIEMLACHWTGHDAQNRRVGGIAGFCGEGHPYVRVDPDGTVTWAPS